MCAYLRKSAQLACSSERKSYVDCSTNEKCSSRFAQLKTSPFLACSYFLIWRRVHVATVLNCKNGAQFACSSETKYSSIAAYLRKSAHLMCLCEKSAYLACSTRLLTQRKVVVSLCSPEKKCSRWRAHYLEMSTCRQFALLSKSSVKNVHNWLAQLKPNFNYTAHLRKSAHLVCSSENRCSSGLFFWWKVLF